MLVEVTTVEQLIERLRKGKYKSSGEIVAKSTLMYHLRSASPHCVLRSDSICHQ